MLVLFEKAVANVQSIWDSCCYLNNNFQPLFNEDGDLMTSQINSIEDPSFWRAIPTCVPYAYVLEKLKDTKDVQFVYLNQKVTEEIVNAWKSVDESLASWLQTIKMVPYAQLSKEEQAKVVTTVDVEVNWPARCEPMKEILHDCPLTKAAWRRSLPLPDPIILQGCVIHGYKRGSKQLGCATANIGYKKPDGQEANLPVPLKNLVLPGTYLCEVTLKGTKYTGIASAGRCPHYGNDQINIEVHIFHVFDEDFYGEDICVELHTFIRVEAAYSCFGELIHAIQMDCETARE